jgi:hypothetical protein
MDTSTPYNKSSYILRSMPQLSCRASDWQVLRPTTQPQLLIPVAIAAHPNTGWMFLVFTPFTPSIRLDCAVTSPRVFQHQKLTPSWSGLAGT